MTPKSTFISYVLQLCIIAMLAPAAYHKLTSDPGSIALFSMLEMEPTGRHIIGFLEATACVLLINPNSSIHGAILSLGIMIGAFIAHFSKIGFSDIFHYSSIALIICSSVIIFLRRKQMNGIAKMLN
jgi:hypothetical protein